MGQLKNKKWELFALFYSMCFNGAKSATDAGYAPKNAKRQASRFLKNEEIKKRITELTEERFEDIKKNLRPRIIEELAAIAFGDVTEVVNVREQSEIDPISKKKVKKVVVEVKDTTKIENSKAIASIAQNMHGIKIAFHDKTRALNTLAEITGIKKDKIEVANVTLMIDEDDAKL